MPVRGTPLCPAGHLPARGRSALIQAFANLRRRMRGGTGKLPISPLAGEMPGRAEGGASRQFFPVICIARH
ncbi:lytic murein transglycosylase [Mesorhizobium sp. B1-1-9]|nr:lytic murein transglycosylase [Mesorhizobium sp. B1-1-7]TPN58488.1 lytic murein transglycosylase [Mesorhizobium sp. B1-1-9]